MIFLHGGPGSGCTAGQRRLFDPERFRVIMIDQRGAGRSLPIGELEANTTPDLVADLDYVREALGISQWIVFGGSWGSLLALAYAQLFPNSVHGLVLRGIFLGSQEEIDAYVRGHNGVPQEAWQNLVASVPTADLTDPLASFARRILGDNPDVALRATRAWLNYERALMGDRLARCQSTGQGAHPDALPDATLLFGTRPIGGRYRTDSPHSGGHCSRNGRFHLPASGRRKGSPCLAGSHLGTGGRCRPWCPGAPMPRAMSPMPWSTGMRGWPRASPAPS